MQLKKKLFFGYIKMNFSMFETGLLLVCSSKFFGIAEAVCAVCVM
jgi:hypothetical protein